MASRFWVGGTATWDGTALLKWSTTSGGIGGASAPTAVDDVFFDGNSGAVTVTPNSGAFCRDADFTGFVGTFAGAGNFTVSGGWTWGAGMTQSHTGLITFNATSGIRGLTSNGIAFGGGCLFNGVGGTWQMQDPLVVVGTLTLTNGVFDTNSLSLTCGAVTMTGGAARTFKIANSTVTLKTGSWSFASSTNLTLAAAGSTVIFDTTSASALTFASGSLTYNDVVFAGSGSGSLTLTGTVNVRDLRIANTGGAPFVCTVNLNISRDFLFNGWTGLWSGNNTTTIARHLTLSAGMTSTSTANLDFTAATGPNSITSNGVVLSNRITFNGAGVTWVLQDALSTIRDIRLTAGTFDTNGKNVSARALLSVSTSARVMNIAGITVNLTPLGQATGTALDFTGVGLTLSAAGSLIRVNNTGSTAGQFQSFNGDGQAFPAVALFGTGAGGFSFGSATGATFGAFTNTSSGLAVQMLGSNTFTTLTLANPHALTLGAGTTQTIGVLTMSGAAGSPLAIRSTVLGTPARLVVPANDVASDYIDAQDCIASGGARWFAGKHGVNSGGNNGWRFTDRAPRPQVNFAA